MVNLLADGFVLFEEALGSLEWIEGGLSVLRKILAV